MDNSHGAQDDASPLTAAAIAYFGDRDPQTLIWIDSLARQLRLPGCGVTQEQVIACLTDGAAGPTGPETTFADRFVARLSHELAAPPPDEDAVAAQERFFEAKRAEIQRDLMARGVPQ